MRNVCTLTSPSSHSVRCFELCDPVVLRERRPGVSPTLTGPSGQPGVLHPRVCTVPSPVPSPRTDGRPGAAVKAAATGTMCRTRRRRKRGFCPRRLHEQSLARAEGGGAGTAVTPSVQGQGLGRAQLVHPRRRSAHRPVPSSPAGEQRPAGAASPR